MKIEDSENYEFCNAMLKLFFFLCPSSIHPNTSIFTFTFTFTSMPVEWIQEPTKEESDESIL